MFKEIERVNGQGNIKRREKKEKKKKEKKKGKMRKFFHENSVITHVKGSQFYSIPPPNPTHPGGCKGKRPKTIGGSLHPGYQKG